ncbi:MAG: diguanylate cyclase [Burkholderiaceae bacterium]|nr:diguanylate cyclase [Burkholderiaceae bacterium]
MGADTTLSAKLNKLAARREAYRSQMPVRLAEIRSAWDALLRGDAGAPASRHELVRHVHSIAGSAGTFGMSALGEKALELEQFLVGLADTGSDAARAADEFQRHYTQLVTQLEQVPAGAAPATTAPVVGVAREAHPSNLVYVVEDDAVLAQEIAAQLGAFGWEVQVFGDATGMQDLLHGQPDPAAVVIDLGLPEGRLAGAALMRRINEAVGHHVPQVMISASWDWDSRLAAVRAGADAYMVKPIDFGLLAERLDTITNRRAGGPAKVLVVEDTRVLAELFAQILAGAGIEARALNDPTKVLDALVDFNPDLILMDLYMPGCSGIEAARVIRQDAKFTTVPIVFLSTESGRQQHLAAMEVGADDFLHKPISDAELITAVSARVGRFRALSALVRQDSLTGLLNHISFKLQLETEIERCKRAGTTLALAMLDIDHFKRVNDTYGHPVGDHVIRTLAQLLRRRLRKSDIVGRYGGEEFALFMPDTNVDGAAKILEHLRAQFASISLVGGEATFQCTFSAGIAGVPAVTAMDELIQAADAALYAAKRAGRNCIRVA